LRLSSNAGLFFAMLIDGDGGEGGGIICAVSSRPSSRRANRNRGTPYVSDGHVCVFGHYTGPAGVSVQRVCPSIPDCFINDAQTV
jgi:hypothetical protein